MADCGDPRSCAGQACEVPICAMATMTLAEATIVEEATGAAGHVDPVSAAAAANADDTAAANKAATATATAPAAAAAAAGAAAAGSAAGDPLSQSHADLKDAKVKRRGTWDEFPGSRLPGVRFCTWDQFKNRLPGDDLDGVTIEVLLVGTDLQTEMIVDNFLRRTVSRPSMRPEGIFRHLESLRGSGSGERWVERVRLHSPKVLKVLSNLTHPKDDWTSAPTSFMRPFRALIYYIDKVKQELAAVRAQLAGGSLTADAGGDAADFTTRPGLENLMNLAEVTVADDDEDDDDNDNDSGHPSGVVDDEDEDQGEDSGSIPDDERNRRSRGRRRRRHDEGKTHEEKQQTLEEERDDLETYVRFVETVLLPLKARWDPGSSEIPATIRFDDLWYILQPGELMYVRGKEDVRDHVEGGHPGTTQDPLPLSPVAPRVWRLWYANGPNDLWNLTFQTSIDEQRAASEWRTNLYCLDYDGHRCGAVSMEANIRYFPGAVDVRSLPFYPLRLARDAERLRAEALRSGRLFQAAIRERYWSHSGWTLTRGVRGEELVGPDGVSYRHPEHVDSEVIVDFPEALQTFPTWAPEFTEESLATVNAFVKQDGWMVCCWASDARLALVESWTEWVADDDDVDRQQKNVLLETDPYLTSRPVDVLRLADDDADPLLLPARLFAYALRERKFVQVSHRALRRVQPDSEGFHSLQINPTHMRMIQALVRFHFERKELEQKQGSQGVEMLGQDFIHGKGRGVVILLHGVPGVGKTATAEAVAQEHRKPLFAITCGDLGITAEDVSRNLSNIFRLANLWDCVLLLDEADVFLSRREKQGHDLQRNALVSVFLRILEYYSGILFLTTNRPGTLDEAVKSRVHASLYYPHLNYDQTMKIFRLNLARLEKIEAQRRDAGQPALTVLSREILEFAHDHFYNPRHQSEGGRWNGRQIRNAFQIAAALAHLDGASSSGSGNGNNNSNNKDDAPRLVVGRAHFVDVAETIRNFDRFRASVLGKHDDEIARLKMERNDEFSDGDAGAPPHGGPAGGPPRTPFGGGGNGRGGGGGGAAAAAFGGGPSPPPPPNSYLAPRDTPLASGGYRGTRQGYGQGNSGLGAGSAGGSNPRGNGYYAQYSQYDAAMGAAPPAASTIPPNPYALPATSSGPGLDGGSSGAPGAGAGATTAAAAAAARYLQADGLPEEIAQSVAAEYRDRSSPTPRYAQGYGTDDATARYDLPPFRPRQSYLNTPGPADPHAFQ